MATRKKPAKSTPKPKAKTKKPAAASKPAARSRTTAAPRRAAVVGYPPHIKTQVVLVFVLALAFLGFVITRYC